MPSSTRAGVRSSGADTQAHAHAHATRLARLPVPQHWIVLSINAGLLVLLLGFIVKFVPATAAAELDLVAVVSSSRSAPADAIASAIAAIFDPLGNVLIVACLFVFLLIRRAPVNAFAVCFVVMVGWLAAQAVKMTVARPRPPVDALDHALLVKAGDTSFPSGHTTFVAALSIGLILLATKRRRLVAVLMSVLVVLVAVSRVYTGTHYAGDVVGGVLTALAAGLAAAGIWNAYGIRVLGLLPFLSLIGPLAPPGDDRPDVQRSTFIPPARH